MGTVEQLTHWSLPSSSERWLQSAVVVNRHFVAMPCLAQFHLAWCGEGLAWTALPSPVKANLTSWPGWAPPYLARDTPSLSPWRTGQTPPCTVKDEPGPSKGCTPSVVAHGAQQRMGLGWPHPAWWGLCLSCACSLGKGWDQSSLILPGTLNDIPSNTLHWDAQTSHVK